MSVNKVIIIGNLGQDPDIKFAANGNPVCRLSIATTRTWKNKQTQEKQGETEWHRVTVWGQQAEHCNEYLSKGRQVYVEGYLRTSSYEKDGEKRYSTEIVAEQVQFLGGKPQGDSDDEGGSHRGGEGGARGTRGGGASDSSVTAYPGPTGSKAKIAGKTKPAKGHDDDDDDDDIPF